MPKVERLHDERDIMRCSKCMYVTPRIEAELRRFNEMRCPHCNGSLFVLATATLIAFSDSYTGDSK